MIRDIIYDNWGNSTEIEMFYEELEVRYELETSAGLFVINEPVGWPDITYVHKRDKDYHGFNYELVGDDIDLRFECESGVDEVEAEYALNGNDGEALFRRILVISASLEVIEYEGRLNMNERKRDDKGVNCSIERKSLHQKIKSRISSKIALTSPIDLDENTLPIYSAAGLVLPGQQISETFEASNTIFKQESYTETRTGDESAFLFFDVVDPTKNTVKGFVGSQLGISGDADSANNNTHNLFEFTAAGSYDINIQLDFQVELRINPRISIKGRKVTHAYILTNLYIYRMVGNVRTTIPYLVASMVPFNPDLQGFQYPRVVANFSQHVDVLAGDKMVLVASIKYQHNAKKLKSVTIKVQQYKSIFNMTGTSSANASILTAYLIKDAMERMLVRITSETDILRTEFYSLASETQVVDGCGANRILSSGGMLRGGDMFHFPVSITWKDMLESMNAIDCIGMGYEWDAEQEKETIRIEPTEYFYQDFEIIELDESVYEYKEEVAKDQIFNKIVVGYKKYKEENENALDEIHAYHEYQTPIKTEANDYNIISSFNASGYLIETTRRLQFETDTTNSSTSYDDDIFIIHVKNDGGSFGLYGPVTNEPFIEVEGILYPETTVNLTLMPKRMLMAHAKWLMSSLIYKSASQLIINTFTKQNKDASTTIDPLYCKRGDEAGLPLKASDNIVLSEFGDFTGIYSPEWVTLKARLTMSQVRYIINAHRGLSPDGNNYGYISFRDDLGEMRKGWLYELTYDKEIESATMTLLKKKFPL